MAEVEKVEIEDTSIELDLGTDEVDAAAAEDGGDEYSDTEVAAMQKGWNPDKEAVPDGKEWIGAGEFMRNESFFTEIRKLKRAAKNTDKTLEVLKEHHKKVESHTRERILAELKQQKKVALEEDDHAAIVEIDEQMMDIKASKDTDDAVTMQDDDNSAFDAWSEDNTWYEKNDEMREAADEIGNGYYSRMGGKVTPQQVYKHVTKQVKRMFPEEFEADTTAPAKRKKAAVEGGRAASRTKSKSKFTEKDLSSEQRTVMNRFVKTGALTKDEYIKELVAIGELA